MGDCVWFWFGDFMNFNEFVKLFDNLFKGLGGDGVYFDCYLGFIGIVSW